MTMGCCVRCDGHLNDGHVEVEQRLLLVEEALHQGAVQLHRLVQRLVATASSREEQHHAGPEAAIKIVIASSREEQ